MKRFWPLALGITAYLIFALATLPAHLLISRLAPAVAAAGVQGTVWKGQAQAVQMGGAQIGSVSWDLHVLPLFLARLEAAVKMTRTDGFAQGRVASGLSGPLTLTDFTASLPLSALPATVAPGGWSGMLNARLEQLTLVNGWPASVEGTLEIRDLTGPARRPTNLGSYTLTFPPAAPGDDLIGALADQGGPLNVAGNVRLKADRSYLIEGAVAARPEAPKAIADSLQFLGAPDGEGRRPFSLSGTM